MGQEPNGKAAENGKRTERKIPLYETKLHDIGNVFLTPTVHVRTALGKSLHISGVCIQLTCSVY